MALGEAFGVFAYRPRVDPMLSDYSKLQVDKGACQGAASLFFGSHSPDSTFQPGGTLPRLGAAGSPEGGVGVEVGVGRKFNQESESVQIGGSWVGGPVAGVFEFDRVRVVPRRCRSVWCPKCSSIEAGRYRRYLREATKGWASPHMLTLTFDPSRFSWGPREAYEYAREHRLVARLMAQLGIERYVKVLELQGETEFPHFHVLMDGRPEVVRARAWWTKHGGVLPPRLKPDGSPMSLQINATKLKTVGGGVAYVSKYLTKTSEPPAWVLEVHARRLEPSRQVLSMHAFEDRGGGSRDDLGSRDDVDLREFDSLRQVRSLKDRIASCSQSCVVLRETVRRDVQGQDTVVGRQYGGRINCRLRDVIRLSGLVGVGGQVEYRQRVLSWQADGWSSDGTCRWAPLSSVVCGCKGYILGVGDWEVVEAYLSGGRRSAGLVALVA